MADRERDDVGLEVGNSLMKEMERLYRKTKQLAVRDSVVTRQQEQL